MAVSYFVDYSDNEYLKAKLVEVPEFLEVDESKYERRSVLGVGGHSTCYEYEDVNTKEKVAVKAKRKTPLEKKITKGVVLRADVEIAIHKHLKHKHIVNLIDATEDKEFLYMMLEFCKFGTLGTMIRKRGRITPIEARYITRQIAKACKYLHANGVAHRDLKPRNIFLDHNMKIKVGDFGWVTVFKEKNEITNSLCGTARFAAPEVLNRSGHRLEVDSWALGCILYTMLVGKEPFQDEIEEETLRRIQRAEYHSISIDLNLPESAKDLIKRLLTRNQVQRLSMDAVLQHAFLTEGQSIPRYLPHSLFFKLPRTKDRHIKLTTSIREALAVKVIEDANKKRDAEQESASSIDVQNQMVEFSSVFEHSYIQKNYLVSICSCFCFKGCF